MFAPKQYRINSLQMNDIDRQKKLETDAVRDGILRYCHSREYAQTTDSKPVRNLVAAALKPLAEAILAEQLALKSSGHFAGCPGMQRLCYRSTTKYSL